MTFGKNIQLPSSQVVSELGEVNVCNQSDGTIDVCCTILLEPSGIDAEGWQTGVAIDASASMKNWYGKELQGRIPAEIQAEYVARGWISKKTEDGRETSRVTKEAYQDAMQRGFLTMAPNVVETYGRTFISHLAKNLDADGGTTVIYWAGGTEGSDYEVLGDFTAEDCNGLDLSGPKTMKFGNGTKLLPAIKYFVDRFRDAKRGFYVFLTDGRLDDLADLKNYSIQLAKEIAAGRRNSSKFVLIGVGDSVDKGQMAELDDLDTGTNVDLWDHKIAADLRYVIEIFAEVASENQIIAPSGEIFDSKKTLVKRYFDGVPAKLKFSLPAGTTAFELVVQDRSIVQSL